VELNWPQERSSLRGLLEHRIGFIAQRLAVEVQDVRGTASVTGSCGQNGADVCGRISERALRDRGSASRELHKGGHGGVETGVVGEHSRQAETVEG